MNEYFIIYFGEDGMSIQPTTKDSVLKLIDELAEDNAESPFVDKAIPMEMEKDYPLYKYMIIKGSLVVPNKVEVVTKYEI